MSDVTEKYVSAASHKSYHGSVQLPVNKKNKGGVASVLLNFVYFLNLIFIYIYLNNFLLLCSC